MPRIKIPSGEIYYAARSNDSSRSHAPLVFLHGAGADHLIWNGQLAAFADFARTIAPDLPGHGRSTGAGCSSIEEYANVLREFLDALKIERAIFVGASMGGAIAQTIALEFSERVAGLVLVGTGAKLRVAPQFLEGLKNDFENTARVLVENFYSRDAPALLQEKSFQQLRKTGSVVTSNDFSACDAFDVRARISSIIAPTLVICGRADKMTLLKYSEFLAQNIPNAHVVVIENAGHMVMLEQPNAFNAALRDWFETQMVL